MNPFLRFGWIAGYFLVAVIARGEAPDWLNTAAKLATPESAGKAPAVVLLDELSYEIDVTGGYTVVHRRALRILHNAGTDYATASVGYLSTSDKINSAEAWVVRQNKTVETRRKSAWVDFADNASGAVVDETRVLMVNLSDKSAVGDVFGYETKKRGSLLLAQLYLRFQAKLPRLVERIKLTLPPGFGLDQKIFGPLALKAELLGPKIWSWSLSECPYRPEEPEEDPTARTDAELLLGIIPPVGSAGFLPRTFANWAEVIAYYQSLCVGQCDTSAALVARVHELVANKTDLLGKIQAIASHVQKLRYVAYNKDLSLGYGYKPRKASVVFSTGFGDCKDKANLLVAMLREAGIKAHPVIAFSGQEKIVRPDWPTPTQFNHAIAAIEVSEEITLPAVVNTEKYGRLLFFDATDPYTMVGDLPDSVQGSLVQVEIAGNESLTALPQLSPESVFRYDRHLDLVLTAEGTMRITGKVAGVGQKGAFLRAQFEHADSPKDLENLVTYQLNDKFRNAAVIEKMTADDPATGICMLSFTCLQPKYVQWLQDRTGIVKLDLLSRKYLPDFSAKERLLPIKVSPLAIKDEIALTIPAGFVASEFPASTSFQSPYGSCAITCEVVGSTVVFKRSVVLKKSAVPVADYDKLRRFFSDIIKADRAAVLLKPQNKS